MTRAEVVASAHRDELALGCFCGSMTPDTGTTTSEDALDAYFLKAGLRAKWQNADFRLVPPYVLGKFIVVRTLEATTKANT